MSLYIYSLTSVLIPVVGHTLYNYYYYFEEKKELVDEKFKKEQKDIHDALFFKASSQNNCDQHIYKKELCDLPDCPYRKLQYMVECLQSCRHSLDVCIHLLTSVEIAKSIIEAHKRGVKVRIICDEEMATNKGSQVRHLASNGVPVRIPLLNYHMHSKIAIIDKRKVMTGSVNWTVQGMYGNWDNLVVTSKRNIVSDAIKTFDFIWNNPKTAMFC